MVTLAAVEVTGRAPQRGLTRSIVAMAMRAPSLHNTQPWRWRIRSDHMVELYADHDRQLHGVDPRGRLMTLSLGAALHHAVVAARSVDREVRVERLPGDGAPDLVARLHLEGRSPSRPEERIALASLMTRRTDRRPFSSWEVPTATLDRLAEVSGDMGAPTVVLDVRQRVAVEHLVATASVLQTSRRMVEREHARWWAVEPRSYDGVPAALVPDRVVDPLGRGRDGAGALDGSPAEGAEAVAERAAVLAICHDDDTRAGWLTAGEALSAVWLGAVSEGLGGVPLSLPVEEPEVREQLRSGVLGLAVQPQVLLRLGWPHTSTSRLPASPRRPIDDVLVP